MSAPPILLAGELPGADGGIACAAAVAVALASAADAATIAGGDGTVCVVEIGARSRRGPTMLASEGARELEGRLRGAGLSASARGRLAWVTIEYEETGVADAHEHLRDRVRACVDEGAASRAVVIFAPVDAWHGLLADRSLGIAAAHLRAELPAQRSLASLAVRELRASGLRVRISGRAPGRVASRRALAGIDPGGDMGRRASRLAAGLKVGAAASGQAMPMVLGAVAALVCAALALGAFGGAVTGKSRAQRAADLAALSAARSMRDDFARLFVPARRPGGGPNPAHLSKSEYLERAEDSALEAAVQNDVAPARVRVSFPDDESFAPLRVRARLEARIELGAGAAGTSVYAEAKAAPPSAGTGSGNPTMASGGGYSGPLVYRQGKPMRPDVAAAFDRLAAAASEAGLALLVNSAFRSDAEQAVLWAANPDPTWVAPPGTSLHRCATELDLGPSAAYGWLAANAPRFGFVQRYAWEAWHYGYVAGPEPCSAEGDRLEAGGAVPDRRDGGDGASAEGGLPSYVPDRFRELIATAASRWNVSAALLAAQLMAESNFNPYAVSPAGAAGIAQFMPGTAAMYGLDDPFDPAQAIDAQARLMADLLDQFGGDVSLALAGYNAGPGAVEGCSCVPPYPETQAYVARILGLMDGAGELSAPVLEVRLVD